MESHFSKLPKLSKPADEENLSSQSNNSTIVQNNLSGNHTTDDRLQIAINDEDCNRSSLCISNGSSFPVISSSSTNQQNVNESEQTERSFISKTDIAYAVDNPKISDKEKYDICENPDEPPDDDTFPPDFDNRTYQPTWKKKHHWLTYSKSKGGVFCRFCVLFLTDKDNQSNKALGRLVKTAYNDNYRVSYIFLNHCSSFDDCS